MQDYCDEIDPRTQDDGRLKAALLKSALALVHDPVEADALVEQTLEAAGEAESGASPLAEATVFRLLRQAYHSIERSRPRRRMRDALVTSLAADQGQPRPDPDQ